MENIVRVLTFLFGVFKLTSETVLTSPTVVGMKGNRVTLDCRYQSSERWYLMQWKRHVPDGKDITIVTLLNTPKSTTPDPIWEDGIKDISDDFRDRARISIFVDTNSVNFSLSINQFSCNDTGHYICEATTTRPVKSTTNLTITAKPKPPLVIEDEVIVEENDTYSLECSAMAGIPAADLRWYYKMPDSKNFERITDESKQKNIAMDDCSQKAVHPLDVFITQDTDGVVYRCMVESDLLSNEEKAKFYDDVLFKLPKKIVNQPQYKIPATEKPQDTNKSNSFSIYTAVLVTGLIVIARHIV